MIAPVAELLAGRRTVILTGAGCSTESGIPDYRGEGTRARAKSPIQYRQFLSSPAVRARYWSRAMVGYQRVASAAPNDGHHAIAELEHMGAAVGVITQNVDGLHRRAGSRQLVELHGDLGWVRCLDCRRREPRADVQHRLIIDNPFLADRRAPAAPDGDAELEGVDESFQLPSCRFCQGVLKPDVVFFGESVPAGDTRRAWELFDAAEVLLVVGSSLAVFSGYRFVKRAAERGMPVAIVNRGPTRGDDCATVKLEASAGSAMRRLCGALGMAGRRAG